MSHRLLVADRERAGREASPTAAVINSQSVKPNESDGPYGHDAGKKVKGRKRQVRVYIDGQGLVLELQPADVQDRDGGAVLLRLLERCFADGGFLAGLTRCVQLRLRAGRKANLSLSLHRRGH